MGCVFLRVGGRCFGSGALSFKPVFRVSTQPVSSAPLCHAPSPLFWGLQQGRRGGQLSPSITTDVFCAFCERQWGQHACVFCEWQWGGIGMCTLHPYLCYVHAGTFFFVGPGDTHGWVPVFLHPFSACPTEGCALCMHTGWMGFQTLLHTRCGVGWQPPTVPVCAARQ